MNTKKVVKKFLTHHNLQGSQTISSVVCLTVRFLTHHNLQGSQTLTVIFYSNNGFLTHHNLQGSQTKGKYKPHKL